ncbi:hypothetical protein RSOL_187460 [Rhizoctonia solani AG-3 Rhs1AP]|nr:hypothetical protein RSOL_187460 [Rhizoctonia solani AG-3 Rhs1AP]
MPTDTTSSAEEPILPVVPVGSKTSLASGNTIAIRSEPGAKASKTASTIPAPISAPVSTTSSIATKGCSSSPDPNAPSYQSSGPGVQHKASPAASAKSKGLPSPNSTRIILERGFDLFPALCQITKRCAKTVCLYNYSGLTATISIAVMLRANIKVPVMIPSSTKQEKLVAAAKQFNSAQSGVLLWPGSITLPEITGLADLSNVQLIQLGLPIKTSIATASSIATVILARSDLTQPQAAQNKDLPIDSLSESCNQQGPKSPLEPFRIWLRSRLSDDSFARGFYWDWFMQYRRQNPKQSIIDALKLANQYAEQFLLRGESKKYGEPVGGKVTVTEGTVRNQKLEAAVKAGVLLVA